METLDLGQMDISARKAVYDFLMYLKVARRTDPTLCIAMLAGDEFRPHAQKIEKLIGWTAADDEIAMRLAKQMTEETKGHTLPERSHKISKSVLAWALAGLGAAVAGGVAYYKHKKNGDEEKK